MHERGVAAMGGAPPNPGKIKALRKNIARIYTVQSEEGGKTAAATAAPKPPAPAPPEKRAPKEAEEDLEEDKP